MIRTASEFEHVYEQSRDQDVDELIDQHYERLGLEGLDAEWLREAYEDAGAMSSEDDYTFVIPRQQPASTVEQISMQQVATMLGEDLQDQGLIDSYSVVGAPLTDKMYSRNSEKRGYAMPVVSTEAALWDTQVTDIQDGYSIGSHEVKLRENSDQIVEQMLGADSEASNLRELHDSLETPLVETRGDFTEIQRSMIEQMIAHGQEPEVIGYEDGDGKIVGMKHNPEADTYQSLDDRRDINLSMEEASNQGILPPDVNYETLVFPSALHTDIGYILRGLDNEKFRTESTDELERQAQNEGLNRFPFIDVSSDGGYHARVPGEVMDELDDTRFGGSSSLKKDGMVLNLYPSESKREEIRDADLRSEEFDEVTEQILNMTFR
ncbi:MAG: hypothetical protein J07AB43_13650 [Candidatus Nanosalina sp. J07AB43]|nr:MAG: hypothetical protein J07AB43_13650 [Candidatus Nanosalina sp. J07AB43]